MLSNVSELKRKDLYQSHYPLPQGIEHFHFGYRENIADGAWLRLIQDFDYCENEVSRKVCRSNGWVSKILYEISYLSPHFRMAMLTGPLMLSVVVNDIEGASRLFDRAVELFPDDWNILYAASYHARVEENNKDKAAQLLIRAAKLGAPAWLYNLAGKLYEEAGEKEMARGLYEGLKKSNISPALLEDMRLKLGVTD